MGEEEARKDIIYLSPDIVKPKGGNPRRNSTGQFNKETPLSSKITGKVLPHYLRASTNSCHEFCKYGIKHEFAPKGKQLFHREVTKDGECSIGNQDERNDTAQRKGPLPRIKGTPELKVESIGKPKILLKQRSFKSLKKVEISVKPATGSKKKPVAANSPLPSNHSTVAGGFKSKESSPSNTFGREIAGKSSNKIPLDPSEDLSSETNGKSLSNHSSASKIGRNGEDQPLCPSGVSPNIRRSCEKKSPTINRSNEKNSPTINRSNEKKTVKDLSSSCENKFMKLPFASSPKTVENFVPGLKPSHGSVKVVTSKVKEDRGRKEPAGGEVEEKTIYVIEQRHAESKSKSPVKYDEAVSSSSSLLSSTSCLSLHSDKEDKSQKKPGPTVRRTMNKNTKTINKGTEASKGEEKRKTWRSSMFSTEVKGSAPEKLRFQKGKVVSFERQNSAPRKLKLCPGRVVYGSSAESANTAPKKLQFRPAKVLGVSLSGKALILRRSFKRNVGSSETNMKERIPTVVLRHQSTRSKKEEQGLYNEVIEETANKLVETRKSKVKALVGAFETVISLQETKPAASA